MARYCHVVTVGVPAKYLLVANDLLAVCVVNGSQAIRSLPSFTRWPESATEVCQTILSKAIKYLVFALIALQFSVPFSVK